jgi:hypothetical protein
MDFAFDSFEKFSINEKKTGIKKLVGKDEDEELTIKDARKIGMKVANMEGEDKRKYVGIINFLGASCKIYNELWRNYKKYRDD